MEKFFSEQSIPEANTLYEQLQKNDAPCGSYSDLDRPISTAHLPSSDGVFEGEKGNSAWISDADAVPLKSNPEEKTFGEIYSACDISSVEFRNGEPDFSDVSRETVTIEGFTDNRAKNFVKADEATAVQRDCNPSEVRAWRKENGYTWHEQADQQTMEKVPSILHNNIPHSGGVSAYKQSHFSTEEGIK